MARSSGRSAKEKSKMTPNERKSELRRKIRAALKNFAPEKRKSDSEKLCARLKEQIFFKNASSVLFYAPMTEEIDLWPLVEESAREKIVALPCFDSQKQFYIPRHVKNFPVEIISGQFGVRELHESCAEIPLTKLDLILVPGIAFDLRGNRLGRGKGFYDRLLENFNGLKIGVAFEEQIVDEIHVQSHDVKMNFILTPERCVKIVEKL